MDFREYLAEKSNTKVNEMAPQRMKGNAPFQDDLKNNRIDSISERGINNDYTLVEENFINGLDLYKHKSSLYYVLGHFYKSQIPEDLAQDKSRFAIISSLSGKLEDHFYSKQKQLSRKKVITINTVHTTKEWQKQGISSALYKHIINDGYTIISDKIQYEGAVNLWKNFPFVPGTVTYVYNIKEDKIISKYSSNTPDSQIWSDDESKQKIRLVFASK